MLFKIKEKTVKFRAVFHLSQTTTIINMNKTSLGVISIDTSTVSKYEPNLKCNADYVRKISDAYIAERKEQIEQEIDRNVNKALFEIFHNILRRAALGYNNYTIEAKGSTYKFKFVYNSKPTLACELLIKKLKERKFVYQLSEETETIKVTW